MEKELNVKIGDKVLYITGYTDNHHEKIATVTKVTPTGRVKIDCANGYYDKYGKKMGKHDIWSFRPRISILTEEDIKRINEKSTIRKARIACCKVTESNLSYEKAVKILAILQNESEGQ